MSDTETRIVPPQTRKRSPSPGCLFGLLLLACLVSVVGWFSWRVHQRAAVIRYSDQIGGSVSTEPASPIWLHDFVVHTFGEERATGFTDVTGLGIFDTKITESGLQQLAALRKLELLQLHGMQITDSDLPYVRGLTSLRTLSLHRTKVTDV